eukprot:10530538-Lingulodinium_polyedra.AAC.1
MPATIGAEHLPSAPGTMVHRVQHGRWDGTLEPGDVLVTAVDAGAQLSLRGAGEHVNVVATRIRWVRVE